VAKTWSRFEFGMEPCREEKLNATDAKNIWTGSRERRASNLNGMGSSYQLKLKRRERRGAVATTTA